MQIVAPAEAVECPGMAAGWSQIGNDLVTSEARRQDDTDLQRKWMRQSLM
jgi:hypothetical protein